jgi:hypothetical protein
VHEGLYESLLTERLHQVLGHGLTCTPTLTPSMTLSNR